MSSQINSISSTSASSSTSSTSSSSSAQKLTDDTKKKLQDLGVDISGITSEAQGQIALLIAQQQAQQAQSAQGTKPHSGSGKAEMDALKSQATTLAGKLGISVSSDEKISDIIAAIGPAIDAKVSAAGNDQIKVEEAQGLQEEFSSLSSSLSNMQAQHAQSAQGAKTLDTSLNSMAAQNKLYHQV